MTLDPRRLASKTQRRQVFPGPPVFRTVRRHRRRRGPGGPGGRTTRR